MSIFKRKSQGTLVPIHPDNAKTKDWVVLLEATTIVGESRDKLRVALTTLERKLVRRKKLFQKPQYFLDMILESMRYIFVPSFTGKKMAISSPWVVRRSGN
jgi:hypothetical protein